MEENMELKEKINLKSLTDEELVALAQIDIDNYRKHCYWECPSCGYVFTYEESLIENDALYIHETRCPNIVDKNRCKTKMVLVNKKNTKFNSLYFDELFGRYQSKMINESNNSKYIDSFEEIFSSLIGLFMKIVGMFAREDKWEKTSSKWFSSFFWRAVKNKIIDIKKMKNYGKRSPSVKCAVCRKEVGQITGKHLMSEGHDLIFERMIYEYGKTIINDSGEINYYSDEESIKKRANFIGRTAYFNMSNKEKRDFYNSESLKVYYLMFPHSYFKNNVLSTNQTINDDSESEIEDFENNSIVDGYNYHDEDIVSRMNIDDTIDILVDVLFKNKQNYRTLNNYFQEDITHDLKIRTIKRILLDKISYSKIKNTDSDENYYMEAKKGLTSALFKILKNNNECQKIIYEEIIGNY